MKANRRHLARGILLAATLLAIRPVMAQKPETNDPNILHAIAIMIELKLKPTDVTRVLSSTWKPNGEPLSCVYYRKDKRQRVAIAALGNVKVLAANGREQATLCHPGEDMTAPVKYFTPSYL